MDNRPLCVECLEPWPDPTATMRSGLCHLKEERYENRIESDSGIVTEGSQFMG
jgi:hypothetical protein